MQPWIYTGNFSWEFRRPNNQPEGLLVGPEGSGKSLLMHHLYRSTDATARGPEFPGVVPTDASALVSVLALEADGWPHCTAATIELLEETWDLVLDTVTESLLEGQPWQPRVRSAVAGVRPPWMDTLVKTDKLAGRLQGQGKTLWIGFDGFEAIPDEQIRGVLLAALLRVHDRRRLRYRNIINLAVSVRPEDLKLIFRYPVGCDFSKVTAAKSTITWSGWMLWRILSGFVLNRVDDPRALTRMKLREGQDGWETVTAPTVDNVILMLNKYFGDAGPVTKQQVLELRRIEAGKVETTPGKLLRYLQMR
jgi:hypothetical protein